MPSEIFAENILQREALNAFNNMREQAIKAGAAGMSLDEINEEIRLVRDSIQN